jgi:hypothetical protein
LHWDPWISFITRKGTVMVHCELVSTILTMFSISRGSMSAQSRHHRPDIPDLTTISSSFSNAIKNLYRQSSLYFTCTCAKRPGGSLGTPAPIQYLQHNPGGYQSGLQGRILSVCTPFPSPLGHFLGRLESTRWTPGR